MVASDVQRRWWRTRVRCTRWSHGLDRCLRYYYRIEEFTDAPACVGFIALRLARQEVALSDGTVTRAGDMVGEIHLWNEHLPRFRARGPSLGWAKQMHRQTMRLLRLLGDRVTRDPARQDALAYYADVPVFKLRPVGDVSRITVRYGFQYVPCPQTFMCSLREIAESLQLWGLASAHNPMALYRQPFVRRGQRVSISRSELVKRYAVGVDGRKAA